LWCAQTRSPICPYATVMPITSDLYAGVTVRIDLEPTSENGSRLPSQVMVDRPITPRFSDMGGVIGRLDVATMRAITRQPAVVLGIGAGTGTSRRRSPA
jgi:mRNA interferase MazF